MERLFIFALLMTAATANIKAQEIYDYLLDKSELVINNPESKDFDLKIAVMTDVGRTDYKRDILKKEDSVIDLVRTATYIHQIPAAIEMIQDAHEKGSETTANIMAISKVRADELKKGLELLAECDVDVIYLVDSFGAFYPEQTRSLTDMYMEMAEKHGKKIGITNRCGFD